MIERGEKLGDIESKSACREVFNSSYANEISESDSSIQSGFKLEFTKLALINEVVRHHMELESITDDFFDKFTIVLRRTMGLNGLEELYDILLSFGITMVVEILKCKGQKPKSKHKFTILTKFFKHIFFFLFLLDNEEAHDIAVT